MKRAAILLATLWMIAGVTCAASTKTRKVEVSCGGYLDKYLVTLRSYFAQRDIVAASPRISLAQELRELQKQTEAMNSMKPPKCASGLHEAVNDAAEFERLYFLNILQGMEEHAARMLNIDVWKQSMESWVRAFNELKRLRPGSEKVIHAFTPS